MEQASEVVATRPDSSRSPREVIHSFLSRNAFAIRAFFATRLLLMLVAVVNVPLQHVGFVNELTNWDGYWYTLTAGHGYPRAVFHSQTTLGFFPLYPTAIWLVHLALFLPVWTAGFLIAIAGGLVATLLVGRLALSWWGAEGARRAVVVFCVFPGSVVFSMVYSESLLLPLAAGCLFALQERRWLAAGLCALFATAAGPDAVPLIFVCLIDAVLEWRRLRLSGGATMRVRLRPFVAPFLAPFGIGGFGLYLWAWTGSPFASLIAQHDGWGERTDILAIYRQVHTIATEISFKHFNYHSLDLNYVVGDLGAIVLVIGVYLMFKRPYTVSLEARLWTLGIGFLSITSEYVPPNPRLLLTAFPVLCVIAFRCSPRAYRRLVAVNVALLVMLSAITYVGIALRP